MTQTSSDSFDSIERVAERKRILDALDMTEEGLAQAEGRVADAIAAHERKESYVEWPMTVEVDGTRLALYQRVNEEPATLFDGGSAAAESQDDSAEPANPLADEPVQWIVQEVDDEEVLLSIPEPDNWDKERIDREAFVEGLEDGTYELLWVDENTPVRGY